jgi:hypothetical protein
MPRTRPSGPALRGPAIPASLSRVAVCSRIPGGAGAGNNGARKHVRPFSLLIAAARAGIMCTVPAGGAGTGWMPHRGTAKISLKPAVGSVFPSQMGSCESSGGTPTWVVQSFREDSFSEANPALTSENPELSAERPGQRPQRTGHARRIPNIRGHTICPPTVCPRDARLCRVRRNPAVDGIHDPLRRILSAQCTYSRLTT